LIPVGDSVRSRTFPYVNLTIIVLNCLVFLYQLTLSTVPDAVLLQENLLLSELDRFFYEWGALPACLADRTGFDTGIAPVTLAALCPPSDEVLLTPLTSMFLHGGWVHLIGNMLFLWVFGDNVEDAMGHIRYAAFYILAGFAATAAHVVVDVDGLIPTIGASGAISGVLGAYLVLYPRATIAAILPIFILFWLPFYIPAIFMIGLWFALQLANGLVSLSGTEVVGAGGGVAWFAHIGGFIAGVLLIQLFMLGRRRPPYARAEHRWGS
jgi:membrane associated rhomboid family serine protease